MTARRDACGACRHFIGSPLELEAMLPGLSSLSSGFASVRANDGMCLVHDRYVAASSVCSHYQICGYPDAMMLPTKRSHCAS